MKFHELKRIGTTALAIFAMLFGAGNLMLPIRVGQLSGTSMGWGFFGFALTGVLLPLLGLLTIIAYHGDYRAFFGRLGQRTGACMIFYSMLAIGPLIVMPRIISLSFTLLKPFWEIHAFFVPPWAFALFFLTLAYAATFRPTALLGIIGKFLSPLKVASITTIIATGLWYASGSVLQTLQPFAAAQVGITYGYGTLDLIGAIFFGAIIVALLRQDQSEPASQRLIRQSMITAGYASVFAAVLLGAIYCGMTILGALYGQGLEALNEGELFSAVTFKILGSYGAALIAATVFLACFTTTISLAVVVANYVRTDLARNTINYQAALALVLGICLIPASFDLSVIMAFSLPIIVASYPLFIVVTVCNALHKLVGFNFIKEPFILTLGYLVCAYFNTIVKCIMCTVR